MGNVAKTQTGALEIVLLNKILCYFLKFILNFKSI